ncbi:ferredoxin reductase [Archangium violaceum]|uniref:ferredoxin reductase n=1 Tax=Archangium violaceum TaxID=83451 RepID=UPI0019513F5B|nr:ferredoxin reductase [Archangium violaceum]QRN98102.1 ferredoxin reductase [Archangium violaceum]
MATDTLRLRVRRITPEAEGIFSYELVASNGGRLPPFEAGSHLDVHVPGGFLRQYSLCNDPEDTHHRYVIAVQRDDHGRGGSRAMHELVREGDVLTTSFPHCDFPLLYARRYVLVAGGIGITPLLSMAYALRRQHIPWHLHYCTRSPERTAFRARLSSAFAGHVTLHHDGGDPARGLDVKALLATRTGGTRLYCCGPAGLMRAVREASLLHQWPREKVHFEAFSAEASGAIIDRADTRRRVVVEHSPGAT